MSIHYDKPVTSTDIEEQMTKSVTTLIRYYLDTLPVELEQEYKNCVFFYRWYNGDWSLEGEEIHKPFYKGGILDKVTRQWKLEVTAADSLECLVLLEAELIREINGRSLWKGVKNA
jgi:hypothetical protein